MKTLALAPLLVLLLGFLQDGPVVVADCYATPQATVASYWHRMIERRHAEALDCFVDARPDNLAGMLGLPELVELRCTDFHVAWHDGGTVDVNYEVEYRIHLADSLARFQTGDRLCLTGAGWKISHPMLTAAQHL